MGIVIKDGSADRDSLTTQSVSVTERGQDKTTQYPSSGPLRRPRRRCGDGELLAPFRGADAPWFWKRVAKPDDPGACWLWTGCKNDTGYGYVRLRGTRSLVRVTRLAYVLCVGLIPDGLVLDHLCRNPACVNPNHLQPVSDSVNTNRGLAARWTGRCRRGHDWSTNKRGFTHGKGKRRSYRCKTCRWILKVARRERLRLSVEAVA